VAAETDAGQQRRVLVDAVDGVQHRLGALDPLLAFDRAADLQRFVEIHSLYTG